MPCIIYFTLKSDFCCFKKLLLLLLQIDIADVGNDFSAWSVFCESSNMPDMHVTSKDAVLCINDPRHVSFGHRLLLSSNVHGICVIRLRLFACHGDGTK